MAFDKQLAERMRAVLGTTAGIEEKTMFGGIAFLLNGNMCCGVNKDRAVLRINPKDSSEAIRQPGAGPFDITGRPMKGWIMVGPEGCSGDEDLARWIQQAREFVATLPPK